MPALEKTRQLLIRRPLVVEVDGMSHDDSAEQDTARAGDLQAQGLRIFRATNDDVMEDLDAVTHEIARLCGVPWD
jgi:very-short-patch-repair endonuclease